MSSSTEIASMAEDLIPAAPRPAPRARRRRQPLHPALVGLAALTVAAGLLVLSGAVLVLHRDVQELQSQISGQNRISCADFTSVKLHIQHRNVRCSNRKG